MALREQPSRTVLDFVVSLMTYCGFSLILCALPCGAVLGLTLEADWKTQLWLASVFSSAIGVTGGVLLGIGIVLHRKYFKQT